MKIREEKESEKRERESKRKEDQRARKGRKVAKHCVFPMFCGSGGSKSPPKAAGAEPSAGMKDNGAKRIWKSTCKKRLSLGALVEAEMFKKCTRLGAKHMSKATC